MDGGGFEPPKALLTDLQSAPFGHSGTHPCCLSGTNRARTYDPLLVRQVLSQLSYDPIRYLIIVVSFDTNDPEETRTLDLRRDRAAL